MDTSAYTHLCRAGHADVIRELAPGGVVLVPGDVAREIENGRDRYVGIAAVPEVAWARVLDDTELQTQLNLKADMGGEPLEHLGECAVIACAHHRGLVAVIDEREAIDHARKLHVTTIDTLWIVVEAYKTLYNRDRARAVTLVDDLLATGMRLPFSNGESLFAWAYEEGLLP